jgi:hypothetical protein
MYALSPSSTKLLHWAEDRRDKEKSCLQRSISHVREKCEMYRSFLKALNQNQSNKLDEDIYKKAILFTSSLWDMLTPMLKVLPYWLNMRLKQPSACTGRLISPRTELQSTSRL